MNTDEFQARNSYWRSDTKHNRQNTIRSHRGVLNPVVVGLEFAYRWKSPEKHCYVENSSSCPLLPLLFLALVRFREAQNFRNPGRDSSSTFLLNTTDGPSQRPLGQWRLAFFPYLFRADIPLQYYYWTSRNMPHFVVFSKTNQLASIFFQSLTCSHWVRGVSCFCKLRLYLPIGWGLKVV